MKASHPPALATWLLTKLASGDKRESMIGDLIEQHQRGRSSAWYWRQAIGVIATTHCRRELLKRMTPELRDTVQPQALGTLFDALTRLGRLLDYEGAEGGAMAWYMVDSGGVTSAAYTAKARFRNGRAAFQVGLVNRDGRWMIRSLLVVPARTPNVATTSSMPPPGGTGMRPSFEPG